MRPIRSQPTMLYAAGLAALLSAACSDSIGVGAMGQAQISMQRGGSGGLFQNSAGPSGSGGSPVADSASAQDSAQGGRPVPQDTVASLEVEVTAIEFHRADAADSSDGWMRLEFAAPVQVDLMALPTNGSRRW